MFNCRRTHNQLINSIEKIRENQYSGLPCFICSEGIIVYTDLPPEQKKIVGNIHTLMEHDDILKEQLGKYHFKDFIGALKN
jgi:hypothetical protein